MLTRTEPSVLRVAQPVATALRSRSRLIIALFVAMTVIVGLGSMFWVGYMGTDDSAYVDAALGWYQHFPFVGHSHWDLRYPVIFMLVVGFVCLGTNEWAIGASMLLYLFGVVALSIWILQRWFGFIESIIFAVIFSAMPGVIVLSTYASADITELFFVVASLICFCIAMDGLHARWFSLCAGLAAGLAFATRETTIGLIAAYGLLFLLSPGTKRANYVMMGLGFVIVILLEMAYFKAEVDNSLYRFTLDLHNAAVTTDRSTVLIPGNVLDREGNLAGPLSPILIFLASQKYGLIFYAMLGLAPMMFRVDWEGRQRRFLIVAATVFTGWAGFVILNASLLYLVPRYFVTTAWIAAMLVAVGLGHLAKERRCLVGAVLIVLLTADAACLYVENTDPIQASRAVIALAIEKNEPVYTDTLTRYRGRFLADVRGVSDRIIVGRPRSGSLYALAPDNVYTCQERGCDADRAVVRDVLTWKEVERITPPQRAIGSILDALDLTPTIPSDIRKKLLQPNSGIIVYRVP